MSQRRTRKSGEAVRYFAVLYDEAERAEHNAALREMIPSGHSTMFFASAPDEERTFMAFAIAEDQADTYVRRIKAAQRAAKASAQSPVE